MTVWRLIAHHESPDLALARYKEAGKVAMGWGHIGDLREAPLKNASSITHLIRAHYPNLDNAHLGGPSLWRLYSEMAIGDLVIISDGARRRAVMQVIGDYEWANDMISSTGDYQHQREAVVVNADADALWDCLGGEAASENIRWTLLRCKEASDT